MSQAPPILVTGVPRSGTTWLARLLACAPGTALAGREPMNPRGRQYALGGSLHGWSRLTQPTARQRRALSLAYRGLNPLVYSRYGTRQWAAPLPGTRLVVKDPFALLSIPTIARTTGAATVLVYRHPGAVLASYRRMGWTPDTSELQGIITRARRDGVATPADLPPHGSIGPAEEMGHFWAALHDLALTDIAASDCDVVVLSHERLASGGSPLGRALMQRLGLPWTEEMQSELNKESSAAVDATHLHNFDRAPAEVAQAWRSGLTEAEIDGIEAVTATTHARLDALSITADP
ncbi:hypothetical protein NOCA2230044 [metagenome]|uniref:Sulfotransferase n=1 Tax=metagenome TaxID=256318 RepID=A0A2P2BZG2_9ZZZZ